MFDVDCPNCHHRDGPNEKRIDPREVSAPAGCSQRRTLKRNDHVRANDGSRCPFPSPPVAPAVSENACHQFRRARAYVCAREVLKTFEMKIRDEYRGRENFPAALQAS